MRYRQIMFIAVGVIGAAISSVVLAACGSDSNDVATLRTTQDTQAEAPNSDDADGTLDDEAMMMALTECLRDQGIDMLDPVVDAEGNVGKPVVAEDIDAKGEDFGAAWEACAGHFEGFTFEKERVDMSEQIDAWVALATCLREKGYDVDDPTVGTLDQWGSDFKAAINWDDSADVADYEECSGETVGGVGGK